MLFGSSLLPATLYLGTKQIPLGDVVRRAHRDSGLTVEEWNEQEPLKREALLAAAAYAMKEE